MTVYPEEGADKKRIQNHPFIACEILGESSPIHDKIAESQYLLGKLFGLLDQEKPDPTLVGYFSKAMVALVFRSAEKVILHLSTAGYLPKLASHISHRGIFDVCIKVLSTDANSNTEVVSAQIFLLRTIINLLNSGTRFQTQNSALLISDILTRTSDLYSKDLVDQLITEESISTLFECLHSSQHFHIVASANILKALLQANLKLSLKSLTENYFSGEVFKENLNCLIAVLKREKDYKLVNSIKLEYEPLGEDRLKVVELVGVLSRIPDEVVISNLIDSGIFGAITELFFAYPWHSILHNHFEAMYLQALNGQNEELVQSFVLNPEFFQHVFNTCGKPGETHRLGNLGVIQRLSNALKNSRNPVVFEYLNQNGAWRVFVQSYVEVRNMIDQKQLGEHKRRMKSSSSEEGIEVNCPDNKDQFDEYVEEKGSEDIDKGYGEDKKEQGDEEEEENKKNKGEGVAGIVEIGKLEIEIDEKAEHESAFEEMKRLSPLNKRRLSGGVLSPNAHPDFNHGNYWKIEVLVDELDGLHLE